MKLLLTLEISIGDEKKVYVEKEVMLNLFEGLLNKTFYLDEVGKAEPKNDFADLFEGDPEPGLQHNVRKGGGADNKDED